MEKLDYLDHVAHLFESASRLYDQRPNVGLEKVESTIRQLSSVEACLTRLFDDILPDDIVCEMLVELKTLLCYMQQVLEDLGAPDMYTAAVIKTGGVGCPKKDIDLAQCLYLYSLGLLWKTIKRHLDNAGIPRPRHKYTEIDDDALDQVVSEISLAHPLAGRTIVQGHLESRKNDPIYVPLACIGESLRRVDPIGASLRWHRCIKWRVYQVLGSNALWHHNSNEKLRPWGFYVHGCVDGYLQMIIYLHCTNNKCSATVAEFWNEGTKKYGWPSHTCRDYGTENNKVEVMMNEHWGRLHQAYLHGRSVHNVRIEHLWVDVRRDTLEAFRSVFLDLEHTGLLNMDKITHRLALYCVYRDQIECSLQRTTKSWNHHKLRTEGNLTPKALWEASKAAAINRGYWYDDPGDVHEMVDDEYSEDDYGPAPPSEEVLEELRHPRSDNFGSLDKEEWAGIFINEDEDIQAVRSVLCAHGVDLNRKDGKWGADVYVEALNVLQQVLDD